MLVLRAHGLRNEDATAIAPFAMENEALAARIVARIRELAREHAAAISAHYSATNGGMTVRDPSAPAVLADGSWTPEAAARAKTLGRKGPEDISIHVSYHEPGFMAAIRAEGIDHHILVQKHDWWMSDRYATMSDIEQMDWDEQAYGIGFHLGGAQIRRLVAAGRWSHERAKSYASHYETEQS